MVRFLYCLCYIFMITSGHHSCTHEIRAVQSSSFSDRLKSVKRNSLGIHAETMKPRTMIIKHSILSLSIRGGNGTDDLSVDLTKKLSFNGPNPEDEFDSNERKVEYFPPINEPLHVPRDIRTVYKAVEVQFTYSFCTLIRSVAECIVLTARMRNF